MEKLPIAATGSKTISFNEARGLGDLGKHQIIGGTVYFLQPFIQGKKEMPPWKVAQPEADKDSTTSI